MSMGDVISRSFDSGWADRQVSQRPDRNRKVTTQAKMMETYIERATNLDKQSQKMIADIESKTAEVKKLMAQKSAKHADLMVAIENNNEKQKEKIREEIEIIKGKIDSLNTTSQIDLLKLNQTLNHFHNTLEHASSWLKKIFSTVSTIISKI